MSPTRRARCRGRGAITACGCSTSSRDRRLANGRVFAEVTPGVPDGFRVDHQGFVYTSSQDSVQVFHPDGTLLGKIRVPEKVGNVTFGGAGRDVLYIAASTSLYRIRLATRGVQRP